MSDGTPLFDARIAADRQARQLLQSWAKRPWHLDHALALADRCEEMGLADDALELRGRGGSKFGASAVLFCASMAALPRRQRQRKLKVWRDALRIAFGDYAESE